MIAVIWGSTLSLLRLVAPPILPLRVLAVTAGLLLAPGLAAPALASGQNDPAAAEIQKRLEESPPARLDGEQVEGSALLAFYQSRHWLPAWPADTAERLQALLGAAGADGLPTEGFHLPVIARLRQAGTPAAQAQADLLLTDAVLHYASAMRGQRVDPTQLEEDWFIHTPPFDPVPYVLKNTGNILPALQDLAPPYPAYQKLKEKLAYYHAIGGDWPKVPAGPTLKPGAIDPRIAALRARLRATGELAANAVATGIPAAPPPAPATPAPAAPAPQASTTPASPAQPDPAAPAPANPAQTAAAASPAAAPSPAPAQGGQAPAAPSPAAALETAAQNAAPASPPPPPETVYDQTLLAAVQLFQQRHGLTDDGALGKQTVAALNQSPAELAHQIAVTMERWRWLPHKLEENHIIVNVAGAWMEVVENGKTVVSMRTVVGDPNHPTPALKANMTSLVLNPTWSVPSSIATKEILPKLRKDPGYLLANDLVIVSSGFPPGSAESQGIGIDWNNQRTFPWMLRQKAGSDNALGRIKFNIPNHDDIYLHDTPNHKVFARANRALSHGCVRLSEPNRLALYVLRDKDWSADKLAHEIKKGTTRTVTLDQSLPVWLLYWTAWVDDEGVLQLRPDIYGRDERLAEALNHPPHTLSLSSASETAPPTKVVCEGCRIP